MPNKKFLAVSGVGIAAISFFVWQGLIKGNGPSFVLEKVSRGNIYQVVSETGKIAKSEDFDLNFQEAGRLENVYVKVGEAVNKGDVLARLDSSQLRFQLQEAEASLDLSRAKLDKLLVGSSPEEISLAETKVTNARTSLKNSEQELEDEKNLSQESLDNALEDALNVLDDAYLKISNSFNVAGTIQIAYFTGTDQESVKVVENKNKIGSSAAKVKSYLDSARADSAEANVVVSLTEVESVMRETAGSLKIIRDTCETSFYYSRVSSADKTSLDAQRANINTVLTDLADAKQDISTEKLTNVADINAAQADVDSAKGALKTAQAELSKILASAREADVNLAQAEIKRDQAKVDNLKNSINNTILKSPVAGQVVKINKGVGELAEPLASDSIVVVLPSTSFQVEADIYEEDVGKIALENETDISLVAFPGKIFKGKVLSVDPAEKIIDGVVYYRTVVSFNEDLPEGVKPGMTADLTIETAQRENVLILPEEAVKEAGGKITVTVSKGKDFSEKEIEIGLKGNNNMIEIVSGLEEGEEVVINKQNGRTGY